MLQFRLASEHPVTMRANEGRAVAISPDDVGNVDAFLDAGATHLIVMTGHPYDLGPVERLIARRDG